jgi:drug/metabolite transporter (DMT)-like permease
MNTATNAANNAPTHEMLAALLRQKRRQRLVEYVVLISIQIVLALMLVREAQPAFAVALAVSALGVSWSLALVREHRRTLDVHSPQRLLGDAMESISIILLFVLAGIVAQFVGVPNVSLMAHLSVVTFAYFCGSFIGETLWMRGFTELSTEKQTSYIHNLNRSIIFPYNISYLRSIFRSPRTPRQH